MSKGKKKEKDLVHIRGGCGLGCLTMLIFLILLVALIGVFRHTFTWAFF